MKVYVTKRFEHLIFETEQTRMFPDYIIIFYLNTGGKYVRRMTLKKRLSCI